MVRKDYSTQGETMTKQLLSSALLAGMLVSGCAANSGCTQEDAAAKAAEITQKMQTMAMDNPQELQNISARWQEIASKVAGQDASEICEAYDAFLGELN
jgi:outer membrane lipoprotein-sorting protein